jgi:hypothetical protein
MDRLLGLLFFLPVPAVLWLFTRQPLGPLASLGLGVALMLSHRLYARPFALRRAGVRCLWCGRGCAGSFSLRVIEPFGATAWRACGEAHRERLARVLGWTAGHTRWLQTGILGTLAVFLGWTVAAATNRWPALQSGDAVAVFRLGIAVTVLPLGWRAAAVGPATEEPRVPFPVHIQALIGTGAVLWLFRLVGLVWLALGTLAVLGRFGAA